MHIFKCKSQSGRLIPADSSKIKLFHELLDNYERQDIIVTVTLEVKSKVINSSQEGLYKAFVIQAAGHFGNEFGEMQTLLKQFWPYNHNAIVRTPSQWTTPELNEFIDRATAHLAPFGFHF